MDQDLEDFGSCRIIQQVAELSILANSERLPDVDNRPAFSKPRTFAHSVL
jgi:hypothetical protein